MFLYVSLYGGARLKVGLIGGCIFIVSGVIGIFFLVLPAVQAIVVDGLSESRMLALAIGVIMALPVSIIFRKEFLKTGEISEEEKR